MRPIEFVGLDQIVTLLDILSIAAVLVDSKGQIVALNPKAVELFGYDKEDLINAKLDIVIPETSRVNHKKLIADYFAKPKIRPMGHELVLHARTQSGQLTPVEISLSPIQLGMDWYAIAFVVDITERQQAEKQREELLLEQKRVEILQHFMDSVSHDFKTPLATLQLNLDVMKQKAEATFSDYIGIMNQQVIRLTRLVDTMVDIAKLDITEELELIPETDINQLVQFMVIRCESLTQAKGQKLNVHMIDQPLYRPAHHEYFSIAVYNLIHNAIIYTPENGEITISTDIQDDCIVIQVQDTGMGIPSDEIPYIFDRFYRGEKARESLTAYNGLGLAITKRIIELHNGLITVESIPDKGSTFKICLS